MIWSTLMSAPDTPQPTKRAAAFMAANAVSRVVEGHTHHGGGGTYTLADGTVYKLTLEDARSLPEGTYPRWLHG